MKIADRTISRDHPPFIIAEMSGNHNQSLERALAIVEAAAQAGAHGLKIQTYTADTMTLDLAEGEFFIADPNSLWAGTSLYQLYQQAHTPWEWHRPIFTRARERGLIAFSTPFDETAVDFLETLNVPCYKVASFENTDLPLIRKIAATEGPGEGRGQGPAAAGSGQVWPAGAGGGGADCGGGVGAGGALAGADSDGEQPG